MVGMLKRMHHLQELLAIRLGPGAIVMPGDVKRIHLSFARKIDNGHMGPRKFWRLYLPRLKYHNPAVSMTVDRNDDNAGPATLTVMFADATQTPPTASTQTEPVAARGSITPDSPSSKHVPADFGRTRTIDMKHKHEKDILAEFSEIVRGMQVEATEEEREQLTALREQKERSDRDRERQTEVLRKKRREEELLAQARQSIQGSNV